MPEATPMEKLTRILGKLGLQLFHSQDFLIDWDLAASIAFDFSQKTQKEEEDYEKLKEVYSSALETVRPLVAEYGGRPWSNSPSPICVFNQKEWVVVNLENMKSLLKPLSQSYWEALGDYLSQVYAEGEKVLKKMSQILLTTEVGVMIGYLSQRVLAQYDLGLPSTDGFFPSDLLYFVEPNISHWEQEKELDPVSFRVWITLHEVTHSYQFQVHPWVKNYFRTLLNQYLELMNKVVSSLELELVKEKRKPFSWSRLWWANLLGAEHRHLIRKIQALMSLLEGYSDHVMMEVGRKLPHSQQIMAVFKERRRTKTWAQKVLEKIIGLDLKLQQYQLGERFVRSVVEKKGIRFLNQVWEKEDNLPNLAEIHNPEEWIERMKN